MKIGHEIICRKNALKMDTDFVLVVTIENFTKADGSTMED